MVLRSNSTNTPSIWTSALSAGVQVSTPWRSMYSQHPRRAARRGIPRDPEGCGPAGQPTTPRRHRIDAERWRGRGDRTPVACHAHRRRSRLLYVAPKRCGCCSGSRCAGAAQPREIETVAVLRVRRGERGCPVLCSVSAAPDPHRQVEHVGCGRDRRQHAARLTAPARSKILTRQSTTDADRNDNIGHQDNQGGSCHSLDRCYDSHPARHSALDRGRIRNRDGSGRKILARRDNRASNVARPIDRFDGLVLPNAERR